MSRTHIVTCSLTPAKIREFKRMKVVRPEWLLESVNVGYLLPWKNYIYVRKELIESTQGAKTGQMSLVGQPSEPGAALSTEFNQSGTVSAPGPSKALSAVLQSKKPEHVQDPLCTTDPSTNADAARVPGYAAFKSNPNAQRAMAKPEWRKAHTSVSSDFMDGYYKNSRLHHLSTWKSELKSLVQEAQVRAESGPISGHVGKIATEGHTSRGVSMRGAELILRSPTSKWKGKGRAVDDEDRVIMHCDFDCFFVSAGLVSRPELKGKPVVVCHSQGAQGGASSTSEIASSSYEARKFGIHNGMRYFLFPCGNQLVTDR
jgi:DNA repair protein REV1